MSKNKLVRTTLRDLDVIEQILKERGIKYTRHAQPVDLRGYAGSVAGKAFITIARGDMAEKGHSSLADMGFGLNSDGTVDVLYDDWSTAQGGAQIAQIVKENYAEIVLKKRAKAAGWNTVKAETRDGKKVIRLRKFVTA